MAENSSTAVPPIKSVIELLEEDDEFEEFDSNWNITEEAEDVQLWQDDWDDDDVRDEFTDQLRQKVEGTVSTKS